MRRRLKQWHSHLRVLNNDLNEVYQYKQSLQKEDSLWCNGKDTVSKSSEIIWLSVLVLKKINKLFRNSIVPLIRDLLPNLCSM